MSLENIKDDILGDAEKRAEEILAEAKKESARIIREAEKKADKLAKQKEEETKSLLDSMKRQEMANVGLESKKLVLESRKAVIEKAFRQAEASLKDMDSRKKSDCIKKLLSKAAKDIGIEYVYCNEDDVSLVKGYAAKPAKIIGGIIAENKERKIMVDYSFDTMLNEIKEKEIQQVYKIIFG
jgi:V/A-type H+-transporting ATPase subunit E